MRAAAAIVSLVIAFGLGVFDAAFGATSNRWCFGIFPIDIVDCKDRSLAALHKKMEQLYADALADVSV